MARLTCILFVLLTSVPGATANDIKSPEPGTSVEMPYLMAPLTEDDRLVAYAYISSKVIASSPSAAIDIRNKTPFLQDAFVRDVNRLPIAAGGNFDSIDQGAAVGRLLKDARRITGVGKVAGFEIIRIQIALLNPRT